MADLGISNSFTAGDTIVASQMNTNFTDITTWANGAPNIGVAGSTATMDGALTVTQAQTVGGAAQFNSTVTVGVDDTGHDVKFFGATASNGYMLWDESTDDLVFGSAVKVGIGVTTPVTPLEISSDDDLTTFISTDRGALTLTNSDHNPDDYVSIDFRYATGQPPSARVAVKMTSGGSYLSFGTSNIYSSGVTNEAMQIDYNGHVEVQGGDQQGTAAGLYAQGTASLLPFSMYCKSSTATDAVMTGYSDNGGTGTKIMQLDCDGDMMIAGTLTESSDGRFKTDIHDTDLGLDFVRALRPVSFRWTHGVRKHYGLIAQEVAAALGDDASDNGIWVEQADDDGNPDSPVEGRQGLRYTHLIAPLIASIQELSARIELLEA